MTTSTTPKIEQVGEDSPGLAEEDNGSESEENVEDTTGPSAASTSKGTTSSSAKKRKKAKSKAAKIVKGLLGKDEIPQQVVDTVLDQVKKELGADAEGADEDHVRLALQQLKIMEVAKGKAGLGGINKKDMGAHKFWETQPVPQLGEGPPVDDGFIEPAVPPEQVRQDAYPLPKDFEWSTLDLNDPNQLKEVYDLLSLNYVEDDDAAFRFQYSAEFLQWALKPPGYFKEWHVGVRVSSNKKLVAFISGVPLNLRVRGNTFRASEINYLCVHKKLRSKRLAPVLIKEVTRQCHLKGIFQAIYTAGVVLPTPVSVCRYFHRPLNIPKLVEVRFCFVPRNMTIARMVRSMKVPAKLEHKPTDASQLREMMDKDVSAVAKLFTRYMQRFDMAPVFTPDEIRHQFLSGRGEGEIENGRRQGQVTWTYVREDTKTRKITDFFSFYSLPSTIINNQKHNILEAAYLFYYATDAAFDASSDMDDRIKTRVHDLVSDALAVADRAKFDVFNALTLMDNVPVLADLKFGQGDGFLNFYLYNWRTAPLAGLNAAGDVKPGRGVGVVTL